MVDVSKRSVTIEITGTDDKIEAFERHGPPVRPDRDGAHRRDRGLARALRHVTVRSDAVQGPLRLSDSAWAQLETRVERAIAAARRGRGRVLASVTAPVPAEIDLSAAVLAARGSGDRYFCLEQPDRDGFALAALGQAALVEAHGHGSLRARGRGLPGAGRGALGGDEAADRSAPPGSGPVWVGGFAFAPDGGTTPRVVVALAGASWSCRS